MEALKTHAKTFTLVTMRNKELKIIKDKENSLRKRYLEAALVFKKNSKFRMAAQCYYSA